MENRFIARSNILRLTRIMGEHYAINPQVVKRMYREKYFSFGRAVKPKPFPPLASNRDDAIEKMKLKEQLIHRLPGINCSVCGAPDCVTLADDVVRGRAKIEDCIYMINTERQVVSEGKT